MADIRAVVDDLRAESDDLEARVAQLTDAQWRTPTPAAGWTVADQIGHLAWTDEIACLAVTDPAAFDAAVQAMIGELDGYVDRAAAQRADRSPADLLQSWRAGRAQLHEALLGVPADARLSWFGPPMSPASMATARLMETWAHGQDVVDALDQLRAPSPRLRHVAHIGVRTRDFAYLLRDRTPPTEAFRIELSAPSGELWAWGPEDAAQQVAGPALHFCLLVTQRRHRDDLALVAVGPDADEWLDIAQAFAGPPGTGRAPGRHV